MEVRNSYPHIKKGLFSEARLHKYVLLVFAVSLLTCGIVNLCVGGQPWCLYVLGAQLLVWVVFIDRPLIEYTWLGRISAAVLGTAAYLVLLDFFGVLGDVSSDFVVPVLCFALLIAQGTLFFVFFRRRRLNAMPMYWLILAGLLAIVGALLGWNRMNWPTIVLGSVALALLIAGFIVYRGQLITELKKRFHA